MTVPESQGNHRSSKLGTPETWLSWLSVAAIIYMLLAALIFGALGKSAEMGLAVLAGGLACAFANLQQFESFKGAGFAGQLRKRVDEQAVRIDHLTRLATALGRPMLGILIGEGRWGGMGRLQREEMHAAVNKELRELGLSDRDISRVNEIWNWYKAYDAVAGALAYNPNTIPGDQKEAMENERKAIIDFKEGRLPTVAEAAAFIDKWFNGSEHYEHRKEQLAAYEAKLSEYKRAVMASGV